MIFKVGDKVKLKNSVNILSLSNGIVVKITKDKKIYWKSIDGYTHWDFESELTLDNEESLK